MEENVADLIEAARQARERAYAPYSRYSVGAAVLTDDGRIFAGANVENASYGLSLCAERAAIACAVVGGARRLAAIAVVTGSDPPAAPCGACRQWLAELGEGGLVVIAANTRGHVRRYTLAELLPHAFSLSAVSSRAE